MKQIATALVLVGLFSAACGGDGNGGGDTAGNVVISAADADRVAHAGLPAIEDLPGSDWLITGEDEFSSGGGSDFLEFIEGNPECETLENLAALEGVFGGAEEDEPPIGQAQVEFEQQDPDALIPTNVEISIEVDQSSAGSRAQFALVRDLFESDQTSDCLISVLNAQFAETGPGGLQIEVKKGSGSASAPQDGARMAFDVEMSFAGIEFQLAMQLYFWPYGNANVQALFLGTKDMLNGDLVGGVLDAVDANLEAAAGE